MAIISQETWDKFTEEEKKKIREKHRYEFMEGSQLDAILMEDIFGKKNLQYTSKIRTWEDVKKENLIDETLEEQLGVLSYWDGETKAICDKCSATIKISKLIELGYGGSVSKEEWSDKELCKWYIVIGIEGKLQIDSSYENWQEFISFHTKQQAEEFMSHSENVELIRQYYML